MFKIILLVVAATTTQAYKSILPGSLVHEGISNTAWKNNGLVDTWDATISGVAKTDYTAFYKGTQAPDAPCENNAESPELCLGQMSGDAILDTTCTIFWRMTYADLSVWHSMASGQPGITNLQVRDKILDLIRGYWTFSLGKADSDSLQAYFAIGKIAHAIQDSYSKSHSIREGPALGIRRFSYYGAQDKHGDADKQTDDAQYAQAVNATTRLIALYESRADWAIVHEWLISSVYNFADGAAAEIAGGSDSRYACNGKSCSPPKYSKPSRSMEITIVNNLGYDITYKDHVMASSGGGCFSCFADYQGTIVPSFTSSLPCETIKQGESCTWKMESCGIMTGLEATFLYQAQGKTVEIGVRNSYSVFYANQFTVKGVNAQLDKSRLKGDNAVVSGTLIA